MGRNGLIYPVKGGQGHERKGSPGEGLELAAQLHLEAYLVAAPLLDLLLDFLDADGGQQAANQEEQHRQSGDEKVRKGDLATSRGDDEQGGSRREYGEPRECNAEDVHDGEGLEQLGQVIQLVLELICDAQVGQAYVQGPDGQFLVEHRRDVHVCYRSSQRPRVE